MKNIFLVCLLVSGCKSFGPAPVTVVVDKTFDMQSDYSGNRFTFDSGTQLSGSAEYKSGKDELLLGAFGEEFIFANAEVNKEKNEILSKPKRSRQKTSQGERLGVKASRNLVCNPQCEYISTTEGMKGCTYQERRQVWRCDHYAHPPRCGYYWETYYIQGWQRVETSFVTQYFTVTAELFGEKQGLLAHAAGEDVVHFTRERILSSCR